jgi:hypothetical protein
MPAKRQTASSARLMALNSMWQMAWISAARPATVNGERCGTSVWRNSRGAAPVGRAGRRLRDVVVRY